MKAIVHDRFGSADVLRYEDIEKPTPGDDEVLIRIRAAAANPLDWRLMRGGPFLVRVLLGLGNRKLKRPGRDVAGEVEAVGRNTTRFKPGDEVFGTCRGAFAEHACAPETSLALKPNNVTFEQAAALPVAALTALQGLRDTGRLQPGQKLLVNGAAGGVGTYAVQIAKSLGAEVTGVCSTPNVAMVRTLGADHVIDYTQADFARVGQRYDLLMDCVGNRSLSDLRRVLEPNGICLMVAGPHGDQGMLAFLVRLITAIVTSRSGSRKFRICLARMHAADLALLGELMRTGKVTSVLDRRYSLREVPEALRYVEAGHARGKVVVIVEDDDLTIAGGVQGIVPPRRNR